MVNFKKNKKGQLNTKKFKISSIPLRGNRKSKLNTKKLKISSLLLRKNKESKLNTKKLKISSIPLRGNRKSKLNTKKLKISSLQLSRNKKGQLKIQQMVFMLLAVTLFFVLVGLAILAVKMNSLKNTATNLEEKNALLLVTKLANSPEFSCGESFRNAKIKCVDSDKIMMLKENIGKYSGFWGINNIEIRKIYPIFSVNKECNLGNYPNCNIIKLKQGKITQEHSNFVSLCRKENIGEDVYDKCEIAKLMISYKQK